MYKETKWAKEIIGLQQPDGMWGYFYSLSEPQRYRLTTEQALRRLAVLVFTFKNKYVKLIEVLGIS